MLLARNFAIERLSAARQLAQQEFDSPERMPADLGITGSTFRAYRNCGGSPSKTYRSWVESKAYPLISTLPVTDRASYENLHNFLINSLTAHWNEQQLRDLTFSESHKLVDLLIKAIAFKTGHPCEEARSGIYHFANIPLDKFSLLAIGELFYGIVVSPNPSMGHIKDQGTYDFLQNQIYSLTQSANLPNLVFDHYAWNLTHEGVIGDRPRFPDRRASNP